MDEVNKYVYTVDESETTTMAVLRIVAALHDESIMALPSLYNEGVNPEALNTLSSQLSEGAVEFDYYNSHLVIRADGTIFVDAERVPN
ncbi:HalOD1 output domain-containing protein [Natrinema amylolyticum]|uniref:HalOD1 output domain-containing protein n=1 Tax=Natrinema amylolyticum TaxID=2878679 RepID=UPI001CFC2B4A|nr:HalOD1 output domain-containing protein [Natrinema amylolyticum]